MFAATVIFFQNRSEDFLAGAFPQRIRSRTHFPAEGYRPHFAPKGSREMLGIVFAALEHTRFGEPAGDVRAEEAAASRHEHAAHGAATALRAVASPVVAPVRLFVCRAHSAATATGASADGV